MSEGPEIARIAALVADPVRSAMLIALMDGRALTATELAGLGGVTKQTASSHLARLVEGGLLLVEAQGRHRYFRLAGPQAAGLLEALMVFSGEAAAPSGTATPSQRSIPRAPLHTGPRDPALRKARICYDHLAGEIGVRIFERMQADHWLHADLGVSGRGHDKLAEIGLVLADLPASNRPLCRACLDWSHRRQHLAGRAGKAILERLLALDWARRVPQSRVITFSAEGERLLAHWLG